MITPNRRRAGIGLGLMALCAVTGLLSPYIWQSALWLAGGVLYVVSGGSQAFRLPPRLTSEAGA